MRWERPPMIDATVSLPAWVRDAVSYDVAFTSDEEKMRLAIRLADENLARGTGGPFGAAVFERDSGQLISVGVNSVVRPGEMPTTASRTVVSADTCISIVPSDRNVT